MAKNLPDAVLDVILEDIGNNADEMHICVGQPADYADVSAHSKGSATLKVLTDSDTDYTIRNGDASGRKLTVAATSITPSADADIDHVVLVDTGNTVIKAVTTASFSVKNGVAKAIPEFDIVEIADPT